MKTCEHCGGTLHRNGYKKGGISYRCKDCGKSFTVDSKWQRVGKGPRIRDWRYDDWRKAA